MWQEPVWFLSHRLYYPQTYLSSEPCAAPSCLVKLFCSLVTSNSFAVPWTVACQAPLSMGFPRQEYLNRLSFPSAGDLPRSGIELGSPTLTGEFFTTEPPRKPQSWPLLVHNLDLIREEAMCHQISFIYLSIW